MANAPYPARTPTNITVWLANADNPGCAAEERVQIRDGRVGQHLPERTIIRHSTGEIER